VHETTSDGRNPQRRPGFRRPGVVVAAVAAATLLATGSSAAFASSSPAPARSSPAPARSSPAPARGYLYWTNGHWIGRARLNGTGVRQKLITGAAYGTGIAVASGYLYWANNATGTIGRARLNGTGVNQRFIVTKPSSRRFGLFGAAVDPGR
jgi:hypothetical protein